MTMWGITNAPVNLAVWQRLYPYNYQTNFGYERQYNVMDVNVPPMIAALSQDVINTHGFMATNPLFLGMNLQGMPGLGGLSTLDNDTVAQIQQNAFTTGYNAMGTAMINIQVGSIVSQVQGIKATIENILKDDTLTEDQKARLKAELEKVEAMEEKVKNLQLEIAQGKTEDIKSKLAEIQEEWKEAAETISATTKEIIKEVQDAKREEAASNDDSAETEGSEGASSSQGTQAGRTNTDSDEDSGIREDAPAIRNLNKQENLEFNTIITKVCDKIYNAIDGMGTNYDDDENGLKNVLSQYVSKDTVLEIVDKWDATHKYDGEDFIESLMDDCEGDQKEEIANILIDALEQRALANGQDVSVEASKARTACKSNWIGSRDDNEIQNAVNTLKNKVQEYENQIKTKSADKVKAQKAKAEKAKAERAQKAEKAKAEKAKKEEAAKAEADKKRQEKIQEETDKFIQDMKECLERDDINALPAAVKVETDGKGNFKGFSIRVKGKDYFGKDYLALAEALEKDGQTLPIK